MKYLIDIPNSRKQKLVLSLLKELGISAEKAVGAIKPLTAKDVALGIGRKATREEMKEYILRVEESESLDMESLIKAYEE